MSCWFDFDSACLSRVPYWNMFVPLCIVWKKNEKWSFPYRLKVYQVPRRIEGCQCTMGILLFCSGVSTSGVYKNGCTSVKLEEGAGRLSKSINDENIERVCDMILQDRQMTTDEVAHQPEISHCVTCEVIHHKIAFHKVRSWQIPKRLAESHKQKLSDICKSFFLSLW